LKFREKLLKIKVPFNNKKPKKVYSILCNRNRFDPVFRLILAGEIVNKEKRDNLILFTSSKNNYFNKIFENFGIKKHLYLNLSELLSLNFIKSFYFFLKAILIIIYFSFFKINYFIENFSIKKNKVGRLIYEDYHRRNFNYRKKKKLISINFFIKIFLAYLLVDYLENFVKEHQIRYIFLNDNNYLSPQSILFLLGKKYKIKTVLLGQEKIIKYSKKKDYIKRFYVLEKSDFKKKVSKTEINKYLKKRFDGSVKNKDHINAFKNKKILNKDILQTQIKRNFRNYRKTILFCPHAFSDSTMGLGDFIFNDYYEFYCESLKKMSSIEDILWIIKLHPTRKFYNEIGIGEKYLKGLNTKNLVICPDNFHTLSLIKCVDAVVTGRGTVTCEAASVGVESLAFKVNRFQNLNFYTKYKSKKDYFNKLRFIHKPPNLSLKKKNYAKKALFLMNQKYFTTRDKIFLDERKVKNTEEYLKNVIGFFETKPKKIYDSFYYKKLKQVLI
tara:strand:+ start:2076 stop:3572 length:1497 start_codon:yes stop_codon:yes gene_type:complete